MDVKEFADVVRQVQSSMPGQEEAVSLSVKPEVRALAQAGAVVLVMGNNSVWRESVLSTLIAAAGVAGYRLGQRETEIKMLNNMLTGKGGA